MTSCAHERVCRGTAMRPCARLRFVSTELRPEQPHVVLLYAIVAIPVTHSFKLLLNFKTSPWYPQITQLLPVPAQL
eukprot:scaffold328903_cov52-Tisochrysis_lutea.AAC.1